MKLRALAMVAIAVALTVFTGSQTFASTTMPVTTKTLPAVDLSSTPAGWVPVAFGDAQISVPAAWWVLYNTYPCPTGSPSGEVFVNPPPGVSTVLWRSLPVRAPRSGSDRRGLHTAPSSVAQRSSTASSCTPTPRDRRPVTLCRRSALKSPLTGRSASEYCTRSPGHRGLWCLQRGLHRQSQRHGNR